MRLLASITQSSSTTRGDLLRSRANPWRRRRRQSRRPCCFNSVSARYAPTMSSNRARRSSGEAGRGQVLVRIVHRNQLRPIFVAQQSAAFFPALENAVVADPLHGVVLDVRSTRPVRTSAPASASGARFQPSLLLMSTSPGGISNLASDWPSTSSASPAPYFPAVSMNTGGATCSNHSLTISSFATSGITLVQIAQRATPEHDRRHVEARLAERSIVGGREFQHPACSARKCFSKCTARISLYVSGCASRQSRTARPSVGSVSTEPKCSAESAGPAP